MSTSEYLAWRGHRVCVTERGTGEPLLLVPGLGNNTDMWAPFIAHFPDRRVITFDAPRLSELIPAVGATFWKER